MNQASDSPEQLQLILQKATRSLTVAKQLAAMGDYDFASSRAYYAVFYAMQAALRTKQLSSSKHSGTIRLFNQHFIKPGTFPTEFSKFITRLFSERQTGDYVFDIIISEPDVQQDIQITEQVVQAVTDYLNNEGFLSND